MTVLAQISESQADKATQVNELFEAVSPAGLFGINRETTTALTWGYYGGYLWTDGVLTSIADGTLALSASATNYVEATAAGVVSKNTTGFSASSVPLYVVVTGAATISTISDRRVSGAHANVTRARNVLINGDMQVAQRGITFTATGTYPNSDDAYLLDQWINLSDGADIVDVSQESATVPADGLFAMKLDVETANAKFGILQIIEQKNINGLIGKTVTLQFKARKGGSNATVDTLRAGIYSWDGTADAPTSDLVSAWSAEGTNPTLVANWTIENTPANLTLTTSYQTFTAQATIDTASVKNIAVFVWCDNSDATVADLVYISDVDLHLGTGVQSFDHPDFSGERTRCMRYFEKAANYDTVPSDGAAAYDSQTATIDGNGDISFMIHYLAIKRVPSPTVAYYSSAAPFTAGAGQWVYADSAAGWTAFTPSSAGNTERYRLNTSALALTYGQAMQVVGHWTASAEL